MRFSTAFLMILIFLVSIYFIQNWLDSGSQGAPTKALIQKAHSFTISKEHVVSGDNFELSEKLQKPVLLHFWATWCAPCVSELPDLIEAIPEVKKWGYEVLTIAEDDDWKTVSSFFKSHPGLEKIKESSILILDKNRQISALYGSQQFPETFVLNKNFMVESLFIGSQKWSHPEMLAFLKRVSLTPSH